MCLLAFVNLVVLWASLGTVEGIWGNVGGGAEKYRNSAGAGGVCGSGHVQESCF